MGTKVRVEHRTVYTYDRKVRVGPHIVRLCPPPHTRTPIEDYHFDVRAAGHQLSWQQDSFGNSVAHLAFPKRIRGLTITVSLIADMEPINPLDIFIEHGAQSYPFVYPEALQSGLAAYLRPVDEGFEGSGPGELVRGWVDSIEVEPGARTIDVLVAVNREVYESVDYIVRAEPGVQSPDLTLKTGTGADRDSAWLLVAVLRQMGVAARFVSGYLVQLTADAYGQGWTGGSDHDFAALHAWVEAYVPGGGWIGLDTTSGMLATEENIPLAAAPHYHLAAPVEGATERCRVTLDYSHTVVRI